MKSSKKDLAKRITGIETCDKMTETRIAAKVRKAYCAGN
jgi:uncharacterized protein YunC (DUF1805 family)